MNTLVVVSVLLCITVASGRHFEERKEHELLTNNEDLNEDITRYREHGAEQPRHRRRRWQMGYGNDYSPHQYGYYPERRDYDRNQQDLSRIAKLLEEILDNMRRPQSPPPPPQPIYVPYPVPYSTVPYPALHTSSCSNINTKPTNITSRLPPIEDTNQNWGFVMPNEQEDEDDYDDGSRPISFKPIKPIKPMKRPTPKVDHDTNQVKGSNVASTFADESKVDRVSNLCTTAIVACCSDKNQKVCFSNLGCSTFYDSGDVCNSSSIASALESIRQAYAPVN